VTLVLPEGGGLALREQDGRAYEFVYLPAGLEPQTAPVALTATLLDTSGNEARDVAVGTLTFDFRAPSLSAAELVGAGRLTRRGRGTVEFTVDEELPEPPRVVIAETGASLTREEGPEPPTWRYTYEVEAAATDGEYSVTASAVDAAGNLGETTTPGVFVVDTIPPELVGPPEPTNRAARPGTALGVRFEVSEALAEDPRVALVEAEGASRLPLVKSQQVGLLYAWSHDVAEGEDGEYDVVVEALTDLAGNQSDPWTGEEKLTIDSVPPRCLGDPVPDKDPPHYRASERIVVRFSVSEDLGSRLPRVTLSTHEPRALPCERGESDGYTCTLDRPLDGGEGPEGLVGVSVELSDEAGNAAFASTTVTLDFTEPGLLRVPVFDRCDDRSHAREAGNDLWVGGRPGCVQGEQAVEVAFTLDEATTQLSPPGVTVEGRPLERLRGEPGDTSFVYGCTPTGAETETDSADPEATGPTVLAEVAAREVVEQARYAAVARPGDGGAAGASSASAPWSVRSATRTGPAVHRAGAARDERHDSLVVFGGRTSGSRQDSDDTWEWRQQGGWVLRTPATSPTARAAVPMAYDTAGARAVLFGGDSCGAEGAPCSDTWEWDGWDWSQRAPLRAPPGRSHASLAYDPVRGVVLLFGGIRTVPPSPAEMLDDTWEWDGSTWLERRPPAAPWPRCQSMLAYDARRETVVLFGGLELDLSLLADTWEWDGQRWTERRPASAPSPRVLAGLAHHPARGATVLFGGAADLVSSSWEADTWEWDGAHWKERSPAVRPVVADPRLFDDSERGRVLLLGEEAWEGAPLSTVWSWDGWGWRRLTPPDGPPGRYYHSMVHDPRRGRTVSFGGYGGESGACGVPGSRSCSDTWEWDGSAWSPRHPASAPPASWGHAIAWDAGRGVAVLHGGCTESVDPAADWAQCARYGRSVWEWDGADWVWRGDSDSSRFGHAMAYDAEREVVVAFGGWGEDPEEGVGTFATTAEWNGRHWRRRGPARFPCHRLWHAMAYDGLRRRVVLFGGMTAHGERLSDTWEWDGLEWEPREPETVPPARSEHAMTYDAARGRVVLFGGWDELGVALGDTWEWDGSDWERRDPSIAASARGGHALAYAEGRVLLYAGRGSAAAPGACEVTEAAPGTPAGFCLHTWGYAPARATPHLVAAFDVRASAVLEPSAAALSTRTLLEVAVRARAGGIGHTWGTGRADGEPVPGYAVSVGAFGRGGWVRLDESPDGTPCTDGDPATVGEVCRDYRCVVE